ncbi:intracellular coagulation inhibitor 2-like [Lutzomyia longipalpis]|uniref:intracellular coagulation inhibitor 2-like n=1 Tax=Lutzomyia longipalpis TaxID=7200 RepID=UPI002483D87B|nr:intracellular coagulation inhibitor 2-like [Lutzomyia longipalpis]
MSPLAVRYLLSSIYPSAMGATRLEMESRLKLRKLDPMIVYKVLEEEFLGAKNFNIANRVFVHRDVWLKPIYRKQRNLQFEKVDFARATLAAKLINEWSEKATAGQIHHIIDPAEIHEDLRMILINAIHFRAPWRVPFLERRTRKQLFHTQTGRIVRTDIMVQHPADLRYTQSKKLQAKIVEIPYASHFVMWILLPSIQSNLKELVRRLSVKDLWEINRNLTATKISLELPKFSIESELNGKEILMKMGAPSLFTKPELDIAMNGGRFLVDDMRQRVKVEINEEGSELGIISWMGILQRISVEFPTFHANRPFMFLILTSKSLIPIFLGHLAQPPGESIQCIFSNNHFGEYDDC